MLSGTKISKFNSHLLMQCEHTILIFIEKTTKKSQYSCTVLLLLQILEILESQCTLVVAV